VPEHAALHERHHNHLSERVFVGFEEDTQCPTGRHTRGVPDHLRSRIKLQREVRCWMRRCVCLCLCLWSCTKVRFQCNLERPTNALLPARILCLGGVRAFQARSEAERTRTKLDTQLTAIMEHVQQVHDSVEVRTTQAAHGAKLVHLTAVQEQIAAAQLGAAQVAIMTAGFNGVRLWACVCSNRDDLWCL